jgi:hypothetical protein
LTPDERDYPEDGDEETKAQDNLIRYNAASINLDEVVEDQVDEAPKKEEDKMRF